MVEVYALKMAILHLKGEASYSWFHGIRTLVHDHILSYEVLSNAFTMTKTYDYRLFFLPFLCLDHISMYFYSVFRQNCAISRVGAILGIFYVFFINLVQIMV